MPLLALQTTEYVENAPELMKALSETLAQQTGKAESHCMITIQKADMMMAGTADTAAFCDIRGISGLGPDVAKRVSGAVCALLAAKLDLPSNRVYLNFTELERTQWGWDGGTFG